MDHGQAAPFAQDFVRADALGDRGILERHPHGFNRLDAFIESRRVGLAPLDAPIDRAKRDQRSEPLVYEPHRGAKLGRDAVAGKLDYFAHAKPSWNVRAGLATGGAFARHYPRSTSIVRMHEDARNASDVKMPSSAKRRPVQAILPCVAVVRASVA